MRVQLPTALTPPALAVAGWVIAASDETLIGSLPAAVAAASLAAGYAIWRVRDRRWHDGIAILALLPAVAAGAWIAVGGLVTDERTGDVRRLLVEVGPGLCLAALTSTILGYHGRHHPDGFR